MLLAGLGLSRERWSFFVDGGLCGQHLLPADFRLGRKRGMRFDFGSRREFRRRLGMDLRDQRGLFRFLGFLFSRNNFFRLDCGLFASCHLILTRRGFCRGRGRGSKDPALAQDSFFLTQARAFTFALAYFHRSGGRFLLKRASALCAPSHHHRQWRTSRTSDSR